MSEPIKEEWYTWKVWTKVEGEEEPRLLTPHADPMQYEDSFDLIFESKVEAEECLDLYGFRQEADQDNWMLCKVVQQPVVREPFKAKYVSVWDDELEINTSCTYDPNSKTCYDIHISEVEPPKNAVLTGEFVEIQQERYGEDDGVGFVF